MKKMMVDENYPNTDAEDPTETRAPTFAGDEEDLDKGVDETWVPRTASGDTVDHGLNDTDSLFTMVMYGVQVRVFLTICQVQVMPKYYVCIIILCKCLMLMLAKLLRFSRVFFYHLK